MLHFLFVHMSNSHHKGWFPVERCPVKTHKKTALCWESQKPVIAGFRMHPVLLFTLKSPCPGTQTQIQGSSCSNLFCPPFQTPQGKCGRHTFNMANEGRANWVNMQKEATVDHMSVNIAGVALQAHVHFSIYGSNSDSAPQKTQEFPYFPCGKAGS